MKPNPKRVVASWSLRTAAMKRTAGEVRFVKDRSGDAGAWGWGSPGPSERGILPDFVFTPKYLKPLATSMRSALMSLGHVISAYNTFVRIKSRNISPDGSLGGKGYIQKIPDMRRQLMNCVEALSAFTDTVYDELSAPHWSATEDTLHPRDREEVKEIVQEAEEIKDDPEAWAEGEEEEYEERKKDEDATDATLDDGIRIQKTASASIASKVEALNQYSQCLLTAKNPEVLFNRVAHTRRLASEIHHMLATLENPNV